MNLKTSLLDSQEINELELAAALNRRESEYEPSELDQIAEMAKSEAAMSRAASSEREVRSAELGRTHTHTPAHTHAHAPAPTTHPGHARQPASPTNTPQLPRTRPGEPRTPTPASQPGQHAQPHELERLSPTACAQPPELERLSPTAQTQPAEREAKPLEIEDDQQPPTR